MTFLPIVERELRVASRRKHTHWTRFAVALAVLIIWFALLNTRNLSNVPAQRAQMAFVGLAAIAFAVCLLAGVFLTADCLSEEKREGTLGLLFLTDLHGYDVVLGKLTAASLQVFYGLLAILPVLAFSLIMGAVTAGEFWRVALALVVTLLYSLSLGMLVSSVARESRPAMFGTFLVLLTFSAFPMLLSWLSAAVFGWGPGHPLLWASPVFGFLHAFPAFYDSAGGAGGYWASNFIVLLTAFGALKAAGRLLPKSWQEKTELASAGNRAGLWIQLRFGDANARRDRRGRLDVDPFYWLASRDQLGRWTAWTVFGVLFPIALLCLIGCFASAGGMQGALFSVFLCLTYGLHLALKCVVAVEAERRLNDDLRSGALEPLLVTLLTPYAIIIGQRRAMIEFFKWPLALLFATNLVLMWLLLAANPLNLRPDQNALLCWLLLGGAIIALLDFYALMWVGMWLGLQGRRQHQTVMKIIARVLLPPWLAVLVFVLLGAVKMSPRELGLPILVWFIASFMYDLLVGGQAAANIAQQFRQAAALGNFGAPVITHGESTPALQPMNA